MDFDTDAGDEMKWVGDLLSAAVSGLIMLAFVIAGLNWLIPRIGPDDYVTIYQRICYPKKGVESEDTVYDCKQKGGSSGVNSSTFRVDYERQRVFSLSVWTVRYDNCQVADRYNWDCRSSDGSLNIWMSDGRYFSSVKIAAQQISWWEYWTDRR